MIKHGNNWITEKEANRLGVHPKQISRQCYQDRRGQWHDQNGKYTTAPKQEFSISRLGLVFVGLIILLLLAMVGH